MDEWIVDAKKALAWFIEILGESEWVNRREKVIMYFNRVEGDLSAPEKSTRGTDLEKDFIPMAVYNDWMAWYMYLIESLVDRPTCDEPAQSARIYPFFAAIGRRLDALKSIEGAKSRIHILLSEKQNQPDSTLFELVVALCYHRNGWTVKFLKEDRLKKTPDFYVIKGEKSYYVECKRLSKVNKFAEEERREWLRRYQHLDAAIKASRKDVFVEVSFREPINETPNDIIGRLYFDYLNSRQFGETLSTKEVDIRITEIDVERINAHLKRDYIRQNSPQLIALLCGEYDHHSSYTVLVSPSEIAEVGESDGLHILNKFVGGLHTASIAKWECINSNSIERKAGDINWSLIKAVSQIPDAHRGIVHIGYETVTGPMVEKVRYQKLVKTIQTGDYGEKNIDWVYCHAIQPLVKINEWECAETTSYFGNDVESILEDMLLLDIPDTETRDTTHWDEDLAFRNRT